MSASIDQAALNFGNSATIALNLIMAGLMFGIALDIRRKDLRDVVAMPRAILAGVIAQFLFLPAVFTLLIHALKPAPSIALGLLLVACSPPGNTSNVLTYRAGGNVALSVSMTALSNLLVILLLPVNFAFWASLLPETAALLRSVTLDPVEVMAHILLMIGFPFVAGMWVREKNPAVAYRLQRRLRPISLGVLVLFVIGAVASNYQQLIDYGAAILGIVILFDIIAFITGYSLATACRLDDYNRRAVTFEVGVRNTSLSLALVFAFFGGMGGMALVTGFWGAWDLAAGLLLAGWWARRPVTVRPDPCDTRPA